jgi:peroxiredoxin
MNPGLITPGEPAPDFELRDTDNRPIKLSDYRGKPVVLAFLRGFM